MNTKQATYYLERLLQFTNVSRGVTLLNQKEERFLRQILMDIKNAK